MYQIANLYEKMGDMSQAVEWYFQVSKSCTDIPPKEKFLFMQVIGLVPTDPGMLQKMGLIYDNEGDKQQAYQYHFDSYRYFPSNLEAIDWLGSYFIEMQVIEPTYVSLL